MDLVRQLLAAAENGNISVVASMLDLSKNVDVSDEEGTTALQVACANGHENVVRLLIVRGADLNRYNYYGWTALMQATYYGHVGIINLLLQNKMTVDAVNDFGTSALVMACYVGSLEIVKLLLDTGAQVNGCTDDLTPLMAASQLGHDDIVRVLLDKGASINKQMFPIHWNAVMFAVLNGHLKIVEILLDRGADVAFVNQAHDTMIDIAASQKNDAMVDYLTRRTHMKPRPQKIQLSQTDIFEAVKSDNLRRVKELVMNNTAVANSSDKDGATPLMFAAMRGHTDIVDYLIEKNANVNAQDNISDWTSLMQATYYGHRSCVRRLIDAGADVTLKAKNGYTAFDMASVIGDTEIVRMLAAVSLKVQLDHQKDVHAADAWSGTRNDRSPIAANEVSDKQFDVESKGGLKTWWMRMSNRFRNLKIGRTSRVDTTATSLATNSNLIHPSVRITNNNETFNTTDDLESSKEKKRPQALMFASAPKKGQKLPANVLAPIVPPFLPAPTFDLSNRSVDRAKGVVRSPVNSPLETPSTTGGLSIIQSLPGNLTPQSSTLPSISSKDSNFTSNGTNSTASFVSTAASKSPSELSHGVLKPLNHHESIFLSSSGNSRRKERDSSTIYKSRQGNDKGMKRTGSASSASVVNTSATSPRRPTPVLRPNSGPISKFASWNKDDSGQSTHSARSRQRTVSSDEDEVSALLKRLSLERYTSVFEEQEVDMEAFLSLDEVDLRELGIHHDQSRKQILVAISELNTGKDRQRQNLLATFKLPGSVSNGK